MLGPVMQRRAESLPSGVYKNPRQLHVDIHWPLGLLKPVAILN